VTRQRDASPLLPLTTAMFHVLLALAEDDRHGYAILKAIRERTAGAVDLSTGTLYTMIKRLLDDGLVVESRQRPAAAQDDERRRYYRLTDFGHRVLEAESRRLESMVTAARSAGVLKRVTS
jgi:DNA-binding PadR family transcriptional regulator